MKASQEIIETPNLPTSLAAQDGHAACPLCGSENSTVFLENEQWKFFGKSFHIAACSICALRYTTPIPTPQELHKLYDANYLLYKNAQTADVSPGISPVRGLIRKVRNYFCNFLIQGRLKTLKPARGRLLDLGCGNGEFLALAKIEGWETYGIDYAEEAVRLSSLKGAQVRQGDLVEAGFERHSFDAITLWHVLEHITDPNAVLAEIHRILRDEGRLVIEVPNSGSFGFKLFRKNWMPLEIPRHLVHFTPKTLIDLLTRNGFDVVRRKDFKLFDFTLCTYSFLTALKVREKLGIESITMDFLKASLLRQMAFLAFFIPAGLFSLLTVTLGGIFNGNGETLTVICRKQYSEGERREIP